MHVPADVFAVGCDLPLGNETILRLLSERERARNG